MTSRPFDFASLLAQLKNNIGRSRLPVDEVALTQIRQLFSTTEVTATITTTGYGPLYYPYPGWTLSDILGYWPLGQGYLAAGSGETPSIWGTQHGTLTGSPVNNSADDVINNILHLYTTFAGSQYINIGDITTLDGSNKVSFGFRFRIASLTSALQLLARWPSANGDKQFRLWLEPGNIGFDTIRLRLATDGVGGNASGRTGLSILVIADNKWHTLAVVFDGSQGVSSDRIKLYFDGISSSITESGTIPTTLQTVADDILIGRREDDIGEDYIGDLHDVIIWNAVLTATQVLAFHNDSRIDRMVAGEFRTAGAEEIEVPGMSPSPIYRNTKPKRKYNNSIYSYIEQGGNFV